MTKEKMQKAQELAEKIELYAKEVSIVNELIIGIRTQSTSKGI